MVIGPTLQVQLPLGLAVEADALYRPLNLNLEQTTALPLSSAKVTLSNRVDTWEFPLLATYRFAIPLLKPYVDTGPNFRAVASSPAKYMSGTGVTSGVGVEARLALLQIAPEVRYTHWGRDGAYTSPAHAVSYQNQIDFLAGFSVASGPAGVPAKLVNGGTKYVSFGVNGGMPFTTAFLNDSFGIVNTPAVGCITFGTACPTIESTVTYKRASRNYLVGALVEVHLPLHFSIEADGLYGPLSIAPPVATSRHFSRRG